MKEINTNMNYTNKYMMMNMLDLLEEERRIVKWIELYDDCISHYKKVSEEKRKDGILWMADEYGNMATDYGNKRADAIHKLYEVRNNMRMYLMHNGIVPTGGEF